MRSMDVSLWVEEVEPRRDPAPGEIEATVKRYQRDGARVVLKPEHPTMAPIVVDPREREVRILGKVVGLLRGF